MIMIYSKRRKNLGRKKRSNRKSNIARMRGGAISPHMSPTMGLKLQFNGTPSQINAINNDVKDEQNNMTMHIYYIFGNIYPEQSPQASIMISPDSDGYYAPLINIGNFSDIQKRNHEMAIRNLQRSILQYDIPSFTLVTGINWHADLSKHVHTVYEQLGGNLEDYIKQPVVYL